MNSSIFIVRSDPIGGRRRESRNISVTTSVSQMTGEPLPNNGASANNVYIIIILYLYNNIMRHTIL